MHFTLKCTFSSGGPWPLELCRGSATKSCRKRWAGSKGQLFQVQQKVQQTIFSLKCMKFCLDEDPLLVIYLYRSKFAHPALNHNQAPLKTTTPKIPPFTTSSNYILCFCIDVRDFFKAEITYCRFKCIQMLVHICWRSSNGHLLIEVLYLANLCWTRFYISLETKLEYWSSDSVLTSGWSCFGYTWSSFGKASLQTL